MVNTQARSDRGFLAVRAYREGSDLGGLNPRDDCGERGRASAARAGGGGGFGQCRSATRLGRRATKKCPREAGSFGVGAYAQTCCASLQGGRQRSRICKCAIAKNGSEGNSSFRRAGRAADFGDEPAARLIFFSGGISRGVSRRLPPGVVVRKRQRRITVRRWRDAAASASLCFSEIVSLIAHADVVRLLSVRHRRPSAHGESGRHNHGGKCRERNF